MSRRRHGGRGDESDDGRELFALYDAHSRPLLAWLPARVTASNLDDVHQDIWMSVWLKKQDHFHGEILRAWLFAVARNCLTDLARRRMPAPSAEDDEEHTGRPVTGEQPETQPPQGSGPAAIQRPVGPAADGDSLQQLAAAVVEVRAVVTVVRERVERGPGKPDDPRQASLVAECRGVLSRLDELERVLHRGEVDPVTVAHEKDRLLGAIESFEQSLDSPAGGSAAPEIPPAGRF